jgi:hypothetical protein
VKEYETPIDNPVAVHLVAEAVLRTEGEHPEGLPENALAN